MVLILLRAARILAARFLIEVSQMMNTLTPKRMNVALVSGVIYLGEEGAVREIHWCMTPDGETTPVDIQPVIRMGSLEGAGDLLQGMLTELNERFAQAAAVEAAKALKNTKRQTVAQETGEKSEKESHMKDENLAPAHEPEEDEPEEESEGLEEPSTEGEEKLEPEPSPAVQTSEAKEADVEVQKVSPAVPSLFDGLDLS
jgi:hypothetical protein